MPINNFVNNNTLCHFDDDWVQIDMVLLAALNSFYFVCPRGTRQFSQYLIYLRLSRVAAGSGVKLVALNWVMTDPTTYVASSVCSHLLLWFTLNVSVGWRLLSGYAGESQIHNPLGNSVYRWLQIMLLVKWSTLALFSTRDTSIVRHFYENTHRILKKNPKLSESKQNRKQYLH